MKYKFTIITVCYNIVSTIKRTCESIINQTFQDFEWIVVDGGSTDGTVDILKEYTARINILISEPDKGIYNAMNKGIKLATGEYINFMNGGDEFYEKRTLEKVYNKGLKADIIYGDEQRINGDKTYIHKNWEQLTKDILYYRHGISHQSTFTRTIILQKYNFDENYIISADFDFFVKMFNKRYKFSKIPIIVNNFYIGGISSQNKEICSKEYKKIRKKHFTIKYFICNKIEPLLEFLYNSIRYPRYFAGWIKQKLLKPKK